MADWLIAPARGPLTFRRALGPWLAAPLVWTTFTLIRGAVDGWYPYPFLNPANGGYGTVAIYAAGILVLFLAVVWLVASVGTALRARLRDP